MAPFMRGDKHSKSPSNQNPNPNQDGGRKSFWFSLGGWVLLVVPIATAAVVNYFSSDPRILYFCVIVFDVWLIWKVWRSGRGKRVFVVVFCVIAAFGTHKYVQFKLNHLAIKPPFAWPNHIQLHDGEWEVNSPVTISNPNPFPIYSVMVEADILGDGVTAESVKIKQDIPTPLGLGIDMPYAAYVGRVNMHENGTPIDQVVCIFINEIAAHSDRTLHFKGTLPIKSSSTLSIYHFSRTEEIQTKTSRAGVETRWPIMTPPGHGRGFSGMQIYFESVEN